MCFFFQMENFDNLNFLIFIIMFCIYSASAGSDMVKHKSVILGEQLTMTCRLPTSDAEVTWTLTKQGFDTVIATCSAAFQSCNVHPDYSDIYHATTNNNGSSLVINASQEIVPDYMCKFGNEIVQVYNVTVVDPRDIQPPKCSISPSNKSGIFDVTRADLVCQSYVQVEGMYQRLTINKCKNINVNESSSLDTERVDLDTLNTCNVSCQLSFQGLSASRICHFPSLANINLTQHDKDAFIKCNADPFTLSSEFNIEWTLFDPESGKIDMKTRAWTQDKGRVLLLRNITDADIGRVVECRIFPVHHDHGITFAGYVGYAKIQSSNSTDGSTVSLGESKVDTELMADKTILFISIIIGLSLCSVLSVLILVNLSIKYRKENTPLHDRVSSPIQTLFPNDISEEVKCVREQSEDNINIQMEKPSSMCSLADSDLDSDPKKCPLPPVPITSASSLQPSELEEDYPDETIYHCIDKSPPPDLPLRLTHSEDNLFSKEGGDPEASVFTGASDVYAEIGMD